MKSQRSLAYQALSALAVMAVVARAAHTVWRIKQSAALIRHSTAFQALPPGATASLLVVGDSTAVGAGASSADQSVAGLVARDHPHVKIVNRAKNGARFAEIAGQIHGGERFDVILVLAGANDVIRLTRLDSLRRDIARAAQTARARARLVIFMPPGNIGNSPFFFPPLSWLMARRTRAMHFLVRQAAASSGALFVSLYRDKADDLFVLQRDKFNAKDGLHPTSAGYRVWYEQLNEQAALARRLAALRWQGALKSSGNEPADQAGVA